MKTLSALIVAFLIGFGISGSAAAPANESERDQQQVLALAKEVQTQQATIADNQTKIDAKMAAIAEALRLARIYSTRGR